MEPSRDLQAPQVFAEMTNKSHRGRRRRRRKKKKVLLQRQKGRQEVGNRRKNVDDGILNPATCQSRNKRDDETPLEGVKRVKKSHTRQHIRFKSDQGHRIGSHGMENTAFAKALLRKS